MNAHERPAGEALLHETRTFRLPDRESEGTGVADWATLEPPVRIEPYRFDVYFDRNCHKLDVHYRLPPGAQWELVEDWALLDSEYDLRITSTLYNPLSMPVDDWIRRPYTRDRYVRFVHGFDLATGDTLAHRTCRRTPMPHNFPREPTRRRYGSDHWPTG